MSESAAAPDLAVVTFNLVPEHNPTAKYERLGRMGLVNRRLWCARHGWPLYGAARVDPGRPACWAKFDAIAAALDRHAWVLWADADALVADPARSGAEFCVDGADIVTQCFDRVADWLGVAPEVIRRRQPINTGVILLRSTPWIRELFARARLRTEFALPPGTGPNAVWDGIGDQEALIAVLAEDPGAEARIRRVPDLQAHPALLADSRALFVHFWGNHGAHRIPAATCEAVLARWERAVAAGGALPSDLALFHWCAIQMRAPDAPFDRGGPERFLYPANLGVPPSCTE